MVKKSLFIFFMLILMGAITSSARSEATGIIEGVIKSSDGELLPGILITLKSRALPVKKLTTVSNEDGFYRFSGLPVGKYRLKFELEGMGTVIKKGVILKAGERLNVNAVLSLKTIQETIVVEGKAPMINRSSATRTYSMSFNRIPASHASRSRKITRSAPVENFNTEAYSPIVENDFRQVNADPVSTFSIDVDTASYSNVRRMVENDQKPPEDAVRIEELINYFNYQYPDPKGEHPFSIVTEISECPWNQKNQLIHIGLQGKKINYRELQASNIVFLIDTSGSMNYQNKLPLLKRSFKLLVKSLDDRDRIAIVVYAGSAGLILPSTSIRERDKIFDSLDMLRAGGSTAGGAGIELAYKIAKENFIPGGNNRVILATDGDFNVGMSATGSLVRMIEKKRKDNIFLTICGFGMGNYKDDRMEAISNAGNGNYYYIDDIMEAKKVFVKELRATLFTIAKDVKIQVEFNPTLVKSYRLVGYENRLLNKADFDDDKKDAAELGAGHTVTALYEIERMGKTGKKRPTDLKYQHLVLNDNPAYANELMTLKLRYKKPKGSKSILISKVLKNKSVSLKRSSDNYKFSAAVAAFGQVMRDSKYKGSIDLKGIIQLAKRGKGKDEDGYRAEFIKLVERTQLLEK